MERVSYSIFDGMLEGVQVLSPDFYYLYLNEAAAAQGKETREALVGRKITDVYPGVEKSALFTKMNRCLADGKPRKFLNRFKFPDGSEGWFELRIDRIDEGVLIRSFDVSESLRLQEEVRTMNAQLEEKIRHRTLALIESLEREKTLNSTKSSFVAMASHEFRTPLSAILSSVSLIEHYNKPDDLDRRLKHVERIKLAVNNLTSILNEFLSLERIDHDERRAERRKTDVCTLVEEVKSGLGHLLQDDRNVVLDAESAPMNCEVDGQLLHNVLLNLLSNALKYSKKDVFVKVRSAGHELRIEVKDFGIGIPAGEQQYLFSRFFRCSNVGGIHGTGLGLTIVRRYVDLMNGSITFESSEDQGTTFHVSIPLDPAFVLNGARTIPASQGSQHRSVSS